MDEKGISCPGYEMIGGFYLFLFVLSFAAFVESANAQDIKFIPPVACETGRDCWIVNYFDHDETQDVRDYACGARGYDAHDGTDFGLADVVSMEKGVDVIAAADGKVLRTRDGMEDIGLSDQERQALFDSQKGCGNGVVIDHGGGWQSIYCHLKNGSIVVEQGQSVASGEKLAHIGHSGFADFPHVHFGVIFEGNLVDPFVGLNTVAGCGSTDGSLWKDDAFPNYEPFDIYAAGFLKNIPDIAALKIDSSSLEAMSQYEDTLVFWAAMYGVLAGDEITLSITAPDGSFFAQNQITQDRNRARQFYYVGKKAPPKGFQKGIYHGKITITRALNGQTVKEKESVLYVH